MKKFLPLFVLACLAFSFSGCASTSSATVKTVEQIAVEYAVIKVVGNNPSKAADIVAVAQSVKALAAGSTAQTVDAIASFVQGKINASNWKPEDKQLAALLLDTIKSELIARVGTGTLDPQKLVVVGEFAGWVEAGALMAQPAK